MDSMVDSWKRFLNHTTVAVDDTNPLGGQDV